MGLGEARNGRKLHLVSALRVDSLAVFPSQVYTVRPLSHGLDNSYPQAGGQNLILTLPSLADGAGVSQGGLIKFIRDEGCCSESGQFREGSAAHFNPSHSDLLSHARDLVIL